MPSLMWTRTGTWRILLSRMGRSRRRKRMVGTTTIRLMPNLPPLPKPSNPRAPAKLSHRMARNSRKKRGKKANKKKRSKANGKAAAKPKSEEIKPHMLKSLRLEAYKNKEAHRRYMHYLRDNWEDSAKVTEVVRLLETIQETDEKTIIFSQWTGLLDMIECRIKYALNLRFCRYTGKMSRHARTRRCATLSRTRGTRSCLSPSGRATRG